MAPLRQGAAPRSWDPPPCRSRGLGSSSRHPAPGRVGEGRQRSHAPPAHRQPIRPPGWLGGLGRPLRARGSSPPAAASGRVSHVSVAHIASGWRSRGVAIRCRQSRQSCTRISRPSSLASTPGHKMHPSATSRPRSQHTIQSISSMANLAHSSDLSGRSASSRIAVVGQRAKWPETREGPMGPPQGANRQLGRPAFELHDETDGETSRPTNAAHKLSVLRGT